jgi:hypothetical protein
MRTLTLALIFATGLFSITAAKAETYTTTRTGNRNIEKTTTYSSSGASVSTTIYTQPNGAVIGSSVLSTPTPPIKGYDPMGHGGYNPMGH